MFIQYLESIFISLDNSNFFINFTRSILYSSSFIFSNSRLPLLKQIFFIAEFPPWTNTDISMLTTVFKLLLATATATLLMATPSQSIPFIQISYGSKVLIINGEMLYPDDLFSKYVEAIGTYDRIIGNEKFVTFYYDELGITILVDKSVGKVEEINFQYLPQRGINTTIQSFVGEIVINDRNLSSFRSSEAVKNYFEHIEFTDVMDVLVMTQRNSFNVGVVFTQDNELELCSIQFF